MYYKGANMLHTIRYLIGDDEKWRQILRGLNKEFYHKTVTTEEIENYLTEHSGLDLSKVFDQYLRTTKIPVLEYQITNNGFRYRYNNVVDGFEMPLKINVGKKELELKPTTQWAEMKVNHEKISNLEVDRNYYVESKKWN